MTSCENHIFYWSGFSLIFDRSWIGHTSEKCSARFRLAPKIGNELMDLKNTLEYIDNIPINVSFFGGDWEIMKWEFNYLSIYNVYHIDDCPIVLGQLKK